MSKTKNVGMLMEADPANMDDFLADHAHGDLSYAYITNGELLHSSTAEAYIKRHEILFDKVEVANKSLSIVLEASSVDLKASLRVVVANSKSIYTDLEFDNLNPIQEMTFFPVERRCSNKEFLSGTRVTDLIWKKGKNTINFNDFIIDEELHVFFVFYYEDSNKFEIYTEVLITADEIANEFVIDKRMPNSKEADVVGEPQPDLTYLLKKQNKAFFSNFYNTADTSGNLRFLFAFDLTRYFSNYFLFPEFMTFLDPRSALQHFEVERYWQARSVGFSAKDNRFAKTLTIDMFDNAASGDDSGIVFFGGIDRGAPQGMYTYKASIILKDVTVDEAEKRIKFLRQTYRNLIDVPPEELATNESLTNLMEDFLQDFSFLRATIISEVKFSEETKDVIIEKISSIIKRLEQKLSFKAASKITKGVAGAGLLQHMSHNSAGGLSGARRLHTVEHTFPNVENKNYVSAGMVLEERLETFKSIKFGALKNFLTMYKENSKICLVNKEESLESISDFDEHVEKYDEGLVVGKIEEDTPGHYVNVKKSMHAGAIEKKELIPQKKSKYSIELFKAVEEYKLEYLASYNESNIDYATSINSENWVEIGNEQSLDFMSDSSRFLVRIKFPQPLYDKYFFVEAT